MNLVTAKRLFQSLVFAAVFTLVWIFLEKDDPVFSDGKISEYKKTKVQEVTQRIHFTQVSKECKNVLFNLTVGAWEALPGANVTSLDATFRNYRLEKGITRSMWRGDGKCGYKNLQPKIPGSKWPAVGSWCDKDGPKPCCTNLHDGICTPPSEAACDCLNCVDTRKYIYAELSQWKPNDPRCSWTPYTGLEACDVIEQSPYDDLHFVGDSIMRSMFGAFMMLLSDDPVRGGWGKGMSEKQKKLCVAEQFFFWNECRTIIGSLDDLLHPEKLCHGKKINFTVTDRGFYDLTQSGKFRQLIDSLKGKQGCLVMIGVGVHMNFDASTVINRYLDPAVKVRDDYYKNTNVPLQSRWPRVLFMLPPLIGLLKPPVHMRTQNNDAVTDYATKMRVYCEQHQIPVFDFRQLTRLVHSFDGSHYGLGVNLMKNQVLLNYIDEQTHLSLN